MPQFVAFVFDVAFAAMVVFGDVSIFLPLEDSLEDGDLEGVEVVAGVLMEGLVEAIEEGLGIHS